MEGVEVFSVEREKINGKEIASEVVINCGAVRLVFNQYSFDRNKSGKFGSLRKNRPLRFRMDRGTDCFLPSVPFLEAVKIARGILNDEKEARR